MVYDIVFQHNILFSVRIGFESENASKK